MRNKYQSKIISDLIINKYPVMMNNQINFGFGNDK